MYTALYMYTYVCVCVRVHQQQSRVVFRVWIRRVWIENVTILPENMTGNEALSEHDWCYCRRCFCKGSKNPPSLLPRYGSKKLFICVYIYVYYIYTFRYACIILYNIPPRHSRHDSPTRFDIAAVLSPSLFLLLYS